jgi:hypothetical protein
VDCKTHFQPNGLAVGGVPSGKAVFYQEAPGTNFVQVTEDCDEVVLDGGGFKYVQAKGAASTLRVGAPEAGGGVELICGTGVRLTINGTGDVILNGLPTVAPTTPGALWRDAGAGNVIKQVP